MPEKERLESYVVSPSGSGWEGYGRPWEIRARLALPYHRGAFYVSKRPVSHVQRRVCVVIPEQGNRKTFYTEFRCEDCNRWFLGYASLEKHQEIQGHGVANSIRVEAEAKARAMVAKAQARQLPLM